MGILSYGYKAGKTSTGKKVIETVKNIFKGKSKTSPTISSVPANVSTTKLEKAKSKFNIAKHKTKMSKAKLNQTIFEIENKMPLTFKKKSGRSMKESDRKKKIMKDNNKVIGRMFKKAIEGDK